MPRHGRSNDALRPSLPAAMRAGLAALLVSGLASARVAVGAVAVFANQASRVAEFSITSADGQATSHSLDSGRVVAAPIGDGSSLEFGEGDARLQFDLQPNAAYFFYEAERGGKIGFNQIGLSTDKPASPDAAPADHEADGSRPANPKRRTAGQPPKKTPRLKDRRPFRIPVKLLVDDNHPGTRQFWERQLRDRLAAASEIFEKHGCLGFEVVAVDTWVSDEAIHDFEQSYQEFEQLVRPAPARLAIGFTCQHPLPQARSDLAGARRPLRSHLLLCESSGTASEAERCELLVHELGHFLGAAHSPEPDSVMRLVLADGKPHPRGRRLRIDPLNTLAIAMVGEELANRSITSLEHATGPVRQRLIEIYGLLALAMPQDNSTPQLLSWLERDRAVGQPGVAPVGAAPAGDPDTLRTAAQRVVQAVVTEAASLTAADTDGEKLTERYARKAALAAADLPEAVQSQAFFLGLAIAIDRSDALRKYPVMGDFVRLIETDEQRQARLMVLRQPTMRGRIDLGQHFFLSAAIMATAGEKSAEAAGLAKELRDARGGSGFSFSDWCADLSGVALARHVQSGEVTLESLAETFTVTTSLPPVEGLKDNLTQAQFTRLYGGVSDQRFQSVDAEIRRRIERLYPEKK
ncbi:MAG TPA: hypothetical protein VFW87_18765 [Pirellulales bacterium]|nr:hypothetical protein [Pirellulales bacterium]